MRALSLFCAAVGFGAVPVSAAVINVDFQNPDTYYTPGSVYGNRSYCDGEFRSYFCQGSNGFNFQQSYWYPGLSLDDEGLDESFVYRADGERFSVKSLFVSVAQYGNPYVAGDGPPPAGGFGDPEYDTWAQSRFYDGARYGVYGLRDGVVAYAYEFPTLPGAEDVNFSDPDVRLNLNFKNIEALHLAIILPFNTKSFQYYSENPLEAGDIWCGDYCTNFAVSRMQAADGLARVPLPAALPLLLGALGMMASTRRFLAHQHPT